MKSQVVLSLCVAGVVVQTTEGEVGKACSNYTHLHDVLRGLPRKINSIAAYSPEKHVKITFESLAFANIFY
jgi:hypothetical protein